MAAMVQCVHRPVHALRHQGPFRPCKRQWPFTLTCLLCWSHPSPHPLPPSLLLCSGQMQAALDKLPIVAQFAPPSYSGKTGLDVVKVSRNAFCCCCSSSWVMLFLIQTSPHCYLLTVDPFCDRLLTVSVRFTSCSCCLHPLSRLPLPALCSCS